jgi:hypothetical protein
LAFAYAWRWPFNFVLDVLVHLKLGVNAFHPIAVYEDRIENTYFRGEPPRGSSVPPKRALALTEANHEPAATPYVIINGNLVNAGPPRDGRNECPADRRKERPFLDRYVIWPLAVLASYFGRPLTTAADACGHYNFEFTRDFTGSDGLGYVPSMAFARPVQRVEEDDGKPVRVTVEGDPAGGGSFRLVQSVAASGAAFDPDGFFSIISNEGLRTALGAAASPLNLNLGYETENFSRGYDGWFWNLIDYGRMLTVQRVWEPGTDARWIKVTDGGHYENLGVAALVRRGVSCIIAIDATAESPVAIR